MEDISAGKLSLGVVDLSVQTGEVSFFADDLIFSKEALSGY